MSRVFVFLVLMLFSVNVFAQKIITEAFSPDKKYKLEVFYQDSLLKFSLKDAKSDTALIAPSRLGFLLDTVLNCVTSADTLVSIKKKKYSGFLVSDFAERKKQEDKYSTLILSFKSSDIKYCVNLRIYNRAVAVSYSFSAKKIYQIKKDFTEFNLSPLNFYYYREYIVEGGYSLGEGDMFGAITPIFIKGSNSDFSATINDAANYGSSDKMRVELRGKVFTFLGAFVKDTSLVTPWRYIVFGNTPTEMLENKYVVYSLNFPNKRDTFDYSWLKAGTAFRYPENQYSWERIKQCVDFCDKNQIKYLHFDAGWYGFGYNHESDKNSDPMRPVKGFDVKKTVDYAREKNIGIVLYVNQTAWFIYNNDAVLDTFAVWGIKGIKLGFMSSRSARALSDVYTIVQKAAQRKIFVNVHDEMRPTGTEAVFKNLFTMEGVRGNEHIDNTSYHTMLLPFTRFMAGAADYTFCYPGYPRELNGKINEMRTTKGHQMALSVIFFSPLQNIFWYGKPEMYQKENEIEFFKNLPTVWDDFKIIDAQPANYFAIARRSGEKWYFAVATAFERDFELPLDFLGEKERYTAKIFEDAPKSEVMIKEIEDLSGINSLNFKLTASGGATVIFDSKPRRLKNKKN